MAAEATRTAGIGTRASSCHEPLPLAPSLGAVRTSAGGMYPGEGSEVPAPTEHEYGIGGGTGGIGIDITVATGTTGVAATGIATAIGTAIGTATAIGRACVGGGTGWCGGAGGGPEAGAARDIQLFPLGGGAGSGGEGSGEGSAAGSAAWHLPVPSSKSNSVA